VNSSKYIGMDVHTATISVAVRDADVSDQRPFHPWGSSLAVASPVLGHLGSRVSLN
jgi:hypothetical protein